MELTDDEFDQLFQSFEHTAFRLETRDSYAGVDYERAPFEQYLRDGTADWGDDTSWLTSVAEAVSRGKRFERVRVVSEPHSDYTRYGLTICRHNVEAGEDIRYLPRHLAAGLPDHDYWLFDSRLLVLMRYDERDDFASAERVTDPASVVDHCHWRDAAWHHAVPYAAYAGGGDAGRTTST